MPNSFEGRLPRPGRSSLLAISALIVIAASVIAAAEITSSNQSSFVTNHSSSTTTAVSSATTSSRLQSETLNGSTSPSSSNMANYTSFENSSTTTTETTLTSTAMTTSTFTPCLQGNATMPPPPCHFGDVFTSLVFSSGELRGPTSGISQYTSDFLATNQTGIGLDCGDMSGGGESYPIFTNQETMTCYAVYPTTDPYDETPLDTVSFNISQVGSSAFDFDVASLNVPNGVSLPTDFNWSLGGGKFLEGKIGEVVQQNYTGPQTNFSVSLSFTVDSKNVSGTLFDQEWSLTNNFTIFLYLPGMQVTTTSSGSNTVTSNESSWRATTNYPQEFADGSCVQSSGYAYCIAGDGNVSGSNATYYAEVSSDGLGEWQSTTPYPLNDTNLHCVTYGGFVYCIGGDDAAPSDTNATYYARLSSSGVGAWKETTSYPMNCGTNFTGTCFVGSCTSISNYVYCMSGNTNAVYYANMTSNGLGQWQRSPYDYPVSIYYSMSCTSGGGWIICIGGYGPSGVSNGVYYAPFSNGQIGPWSQGPAYPLWVASAACAYNTGIIECVGGENASGYSSNQTYYSTVSSSGLGNWSAGSDYPSAVSDQSCFAAKAEIFCVGGLDFSPGLSSLVEVYYSSSP